jgi:hypothetical protein
MNVFAFDDLLQDFVQSHVVAILWVDGVFHCLRVERYPSRLVAMDMRSGIEHDRVGRLREVCPQCELIRQGSRHAEQPSGFPSHLSNLRFKFACICVFLHIVSP